jgi:hypothetical protein
VQRVWALNFLPEQRANFTDSRTWLRLWGSLIHILVTELHCVSHVAVELVQVEYSLIS